MKFDIFLLNKIKLFLFLSRIKNYSLISFLIFQYNISGVMGNDGFSKSISNDLTYSQMKHPEVYGELLYPLVPMIKQNMKKIADAGIDAILFHSSGSNPDQKNHVSTKV